MRITAFAAMAGLGLLAACNQPAPPAQPETPVADKTVPAKEDPAFAYAVNFECEGGGKIDVVFNQGAERSALVRVDGGAGVTLPLDPATQSGMDYKDATSSLTSEGDRLTWKSGAVTKTCTFVSRSLPPPTADGVVRTLMVEDAGASVEIKTGEKVAVALSGVPTAGYVWGASAPPAFVKASDGPGGATSTAQFLPGFTGGSHWEVVIIEGVSAGEGEITLAQRRPWEDKAEPDASTFKFKLKVS